MDEVAKTTSYIGAKAADDGSLYEHVFTTDEDRAMLERFWIESCSSATSTLKPWLKNVNNQPVTKGDTLDNNYVVTLKMPDNWNNKLASSVEGSLFSFFANNITAKWFIITKKDDAESHAQTAVGMLQDAALQLMHRVRPARPTYTQTLTPQQ